MLKCWFLLSLTLIGGFAWQASGQELLELQENYTTAVGENLRIPLKLHNSSDKTQIYIVRVLQSDLHTGQKAFFCLDKTCLEPEVTEFARRLEPGETLSSLFYSLEPGLLPIQNNLHFEVFIKNPGHAQMPVEYSVGVAVSERVAKQLVFQSKDITIQDVYPNPIVDQAFIDYRMHNENIQAKVIVHNILGMAMGEYGLPYSETRVKIETDNMSSGVYFYTVYLDNQGVLTRKIVVRK